MNPNKEAMLKYLKNRKNIQTGKTKALNLGVGIHPEGGPFFVVTAPNDLARMVDGALEWLMPATEALALVEMLIKGMQSMDEHLAKNEPNSPTSTLNH